MECSLILLQLPVGGGGAVLVLSELESMAARQQREIAQQRRLLEQREARLAVLRGAQVTNFLCSSTREIGRRDSLIIKKKRIIAVIFHC